MAQSTMRSGATPQKLGAFMDAVGRQALSPGRVYLVGGASALLLGIRDQTIDIDLKLDPEPKGIFESIAGLKERLFVNVELAAPDDFMPALPGWHERSEFIVRIGSVEFFHYDFYAQALSKLLRGHETDLADAAAFVSLGKVDLTILETLFEEVRPAMIRYPAISVDDFSRNVASFIAEGRTPR